jgi:hypothetical protein
MKMLGAAALAKEKCLMAFQLGFLAHLFLLLLSDHSLPECLHDQAGADDDGLSGIHRWQGVDRGFILRH